MKEKIIAIIGFNMEPERAELYAQQIIDLFSISSVYEIDFGGHCMAKLKVKNGKPKVEGAMNGWGDGIDLSDIKIKKI